MVIHILQFLKVNFPSNIDEIIFTIKQKYDSSDYSTRNKKEFNIAYEVIMYLLGEIDFQGHKCILGNSYSDNELLPTFSPEQIKILEKWLGQIWEREICNSIINYMAPLVWHVNIEDLIMFWMENEMYS